MVVVVVEAKNDFPTRPFFFSLVRRFVLVHSIAASDIIQK
jgi:hypothetical protein